MTFREFDDKSYEITNKVHDINKDIRKNNLELHSLQNELGSVEFKINTENKTTTMLVFDSICELRKNLNRFLKQEESQSEFVSK